MHKALTYLIFFILTSKIIVAQDKITINFVATPLNKIVLELEEQTAYRFYYDSKLGENKIITINKKDSELSEILNEIGEQANISYHLINGKKVILTEGIKIITNFSAAYQSYLDNKEDLLLDSSFELPTKDTVTEKEESETALNKELKVYTLGNPLNQSEKKNATVFGYLKDIETGVPLVGVTVYVQGTNTGTYTNKDGFYTLKLAKGEYTLVFQAIGMRMTTRHIILKSDDEFNVELQRSITNIDEVTVTERMDDQLRNQSIGMEKLPIKSIKQMPMGLGEPDIIKSALSLPGVQTVGEAASGFNVRGGSVDQNLILLNDIPILNTSHFFGFFSGFSANVINDVTLYKSGIPAKFGGRSSSVMDITMKDGNRKEIKLKGGISPVFSRATIEGPIIKDKCSFILGMRTTYSNWILKLINDENLKKSKASFYDLQGNISYDINTKNSINLSMYKSNDMFDYHSLDAYRYILLAANLKYEHVFSPKLFSTFSIGFSNYDYTLTSRPDSIISRNIKYKINQNSFNSDFSYYLENGHKIAFGLHSTLYQMAPGKQTPIGNLSLILFNELEHEQALESSIYISDEFEFNHFLSLSLGLRYNYYATYGPKTRSDYTDNQPIIEENIIGTTEFTKGELIKAYSAPEFRLAVNIMTSSSNSIKFGFDRMNQFIHMISNTAAMSPTDIWKLSDTYLKPQLSDQLSMGFYQNLDDNTIELSIESYYKFLRNTIGYKDGAQLLMNEHLETDLLNGKGKAYGVELMIQRKRRKLTGWVNYTYSRVLHKFDSKSSDEIVNNGNFFPSNYDRPHELKMAANYELTRRVNIASNIQYSTGRPYTAPVAFYEFDGTERVYFSERNQLRMDDYIRFDLALTIIGNLKKEKINHSSWTFSVYNLFGRKNPNSIFFRTQGSDINSYKMSIFGQPIYTVTYNFNFMGNASDEI